MIIELDREKSSIDGTFGRLSLAGVFFCYSLEPAEDRATYPAIPPGTYRVILSMSTRFKRILPAILGVPGRNGIRIHPGNFDEDTKGCVLLGTNRRGVMLLNSRAACDLFQSKIAPLLQKGEAVFLHVVDEAEPEIVV